MFSSFNTYVIRSLSQFLLQVAFVLTLESHIPDKIMSIANDPVCGDLFQSTNEPHTKYGSPQNDFLSAIALVICK